MPKYTNTTNAVVTLKSNRIEPLSSVFSKEYIPAADLPAGVTMDDIEPKYVPVQFSALYTGDSGDSGNINVPAGLEQFTIVVAVGAGAVKVEMNGVTTANKAEVVVAGESVKYQFMSRLVDKLKIYYLAAGTVAKLTIA